MNKTLVLVLIGMVVVVLLCIIMAIHYSNKEIGLRNKAKAMQEDCKVIHDKMWKVLAQKTEITGKHAEIFTEWLKTLQEGRKGGSLLKFVTENYPDMNTPLFQDLSAATEALRAEYAKKQEGLLDLKREHDDVRTKFPGSIVCGSRPELEIIIITSTRTEKAYESGKDDDVELFKKGE